MNGHEQGHSYLNFSLQNHEWDMALFRAIHSPHQRGQQPEKTPAHILVDTEASVCMGVGEVVHASNSILAHNAYTQPDILNFV